MLVAPVGRDVAVYVATPEEFNMPVPKVVLPATNVTGPPGTSVVVDDTVAVRLTLCPGFIVDEEALKAVEVEAVVTVSVPATSVKL
jgi:hypothetical protein